MARAGFRLPRGCSNRKSMRPGPRTAGAAATRGGGERLKSMALTGFLQVREQALQRATASRKGAYFEVEGRPGRQLDPHPPPESGQGTPEPVCPAEVRQRCDPQPVNSVTRRERHPVAAESETPVLFPAFLHLGLPNPSRDHSREGQAPSISSPRDVIPIPFLPGPRQGMREPQTPDRQSLV